jgi:monothiol glutaredoxin
MSDALEEIDREVKENPVVVYMKGTPRFPMCGFSAATVEVLSEIGVPYKAVDVLAEADKREAVKAYTSWPTIPQVFAGGKFVGGCDIVREMHAKGELAPLLRKAVEPH